MDSSTANGTALPLRPRAQFALSTNTVHADDALAPATDVAPAIHVSSTFRYASNHEHLVPSSEDNSSADIHSAPENKFVYSRVWAPNATRLEAVLSSILHGHALTYSSGLSAFHALLTYFNPKRIAIGDGYHGCHGVIGLFERLSGLKKIDIHDVSAWDAVGLGKGDLVHVETPINPHGEAYNIAFYAQEAHKRGAYLSVDATFGPPGLQDPFELGADIVMHSGTKYIGGHSDMLCGVLAVQDAKWWRGLSADRVYLGAVMGSLEGWLGVRSLRTLELRVTRQSQSATALVGWLDRALHDDSTADEPARSSKEQDIVRKTILNVRHASLQSQDMDWLKKQMPNGYGPVFSILLKSREMAKRLPSNLHLFDHATSLGGVESLIEWRKMSDAGVDDRLVRVSIGVEDAGDLRADLLAGLEAVAGL